MYNGTFVTNDKAYEALINLSSYFRFSNTKLLNEFTKKNVFLTICLAMAARKAIKYSYDVM